MKKTTKKPLSHSLDSSIIEEPINEATARISSKEMSPIHKIPSFLSNN